MPFRRLSFGLFVPHAFNAPVNILQAVLAAVPFIVAHVGFVKGSVPNLRLDIRGGFRFWSDAGRRLPLLIPCGCCPFDRSRSVPKPVFLDGPQNRAQNRGAPRRLSSFQWAVIFPAIPPVCRRCKTASGRWRDETTQLPSRGFAQPSAGRPKPVWKCRVVPSSRRTACPFWPSSCGGV